jgi:hypothetical protein
MNILGISAFYHDIAAALVRDGEIIAAAHSHCAASSGPACPSWRHRISAVYLPALLTSGRGHRIGNLEFGIFWPYIAYFAPKIWFYPQKIRSYHN